MHASAAAGVIEGKGLASVDGLSVGPRQRTAKSRISPLFRQTPHRRSSRKPNDLLAVRLVSRSGGAPDSYVDLQAGVRQHRDEGVHAEQSDFPTHEIADPRLRHAKTFSGPLLGQALVPDILLKLDHEHRPQFQVGCFLGAKSQIPKDIVRGCAFLHISLLWLNSS
jgi:hypothetical protein